AVGAAGAGGRSVAIRPAVEELARALVRLHAGKPIEVSVEGNADFFGDRQDLVEMLGNLLDNAWKWANTHIRVTLVSQESGIEICVDDDGPGMPASSMHQAMQPFSRLDESVEGSGLGLSIVRDICAMYDGAFELKRSSLGGLAARMRFPAAGATPSQR
ncbi:two-component sensor histidine kinase, partial [Cupriavidus sp. HMR-1]|uniref:ATP-binding protein n=1 Tax=Cupriavidus sp. HMR-1 TaxID=1249621 RepID=UPI0002A20D28